jgi:hypothetical protein
VRVDFKLRDSGLHLPESTNDEVFDFIHDENNSMELSLKHGTVRVGDERKVIIEKNNGNNSGFP